MYKYMAAKTRGTIDRTQLLLRLALAIEDTGNAIVSGESISRATCDLQALLCYCTGLGSSEAINDIGTF